MRVRIDLREREFDPEEIAHLAEVLSAGGCAVLPTDTIYGLFCNALDADAVGRVIRIKGRDERKALPVAVSGEEQAMRLAREVPDAALELMRRFWPGALTIVVPAAEGVPRSVAPEGTVGLRAPHYPLVQAILKATGVPLVATSANLSGAPQPVSLDLVSPEVLESADAVVDAGLLPAQKPSTVVEVSGSLVRVLRVGVVDRRVLAVALGGDNHIE